jgi:CheY-like chemotaxis protein
MTLKTILVVDDTPENLDILVEILKSNYTVKPVTKGSIALKIALTKPDLILLDILMPEMSGYEVFEKLKENPLTNSIPVIFISANSSQEEKEKAINLGIKDYLTKPIDPDELINSINKLI